MKKSSPLHPPQKTSNTFGEKSGCRAVRGVGLSMRKQPDHSYHPEITANILTQLESKIIRVF